jgi:hypothetical protein
LGKPYEIIERPTIGKELVMKTFEEYLVKAQEWIDAAERLGFDHVAEAANCAEISRAYTALARLALADHVATVEAGARYTSRAMIENA